MSKRKLRAAGCFIEYRGKFLILHRHPSKPDGDTWGLPGGKIDSGETDEQTILREIREETGHSPSQDELEFLGNYNFEFDDLSLEFPTYRLVLRELFDVKYKPDEHIGYKWVTAEECYSMQDVIRGFHDLLKRTGYYKVSDLTIGKGNLAGKGVYAARNFKKGEVIIKYHLKPLAKEEYQSLPESEKMFTHSYNGQIFLYSEPERYVNHSNNPNTYQDHIQKADIALRDITKGEMITTDATKDDIHTQNVLFICKSNAGRSQMAAAFLRKRRPNLFVMDAGTQVGEQTGSSVPENVVQVMNERGCDVSNHIRKQLTPEMVQSADKIIAMDKRENLPDYLLNSDKVTFWNVDDAIGTDLDFHRKIRDQIKGLVDGNFPV